MDYTTNNANANIVNTAMSPTNVAEAKNFAQQNAAEFKKNMNEGNWSLRLLGLMGGLAMIVVSAMGILGNALSFQWISAVFDFYCFFLGILILILESGNTLSIFTSIESSLYKNALFLKYVWGRGLVYFVAGTLQISLRGLVDLIIGVYVCCVGILFILVGRSAARKMSEIRRSKISPQLLQEKFAIADVSGTGSLSKDEFHKLTAELGMDLTRREVESIFVHFSTQGNGRLSYDTVLKWWNQDAVESDDFQARIF